LFAFELARREAGTAVTANALHPGVANTNLDRARPAWRRAAARLVSWTRPWVQSIDAAAATQVYLATAPALAGVRGHFFEHCNPVTPPGGHAADAALAAALWERSSALVRDYLS
jgi:retinol dehydrogenase-14